MLTHVCWQPPLWIWHSSISAAARWDGGCGGGVGKGKGQRQESGRQMGDKLAQFDKIFPIMEREKKKRPHDERPRCAARTREELNAGL